MAYKTASFTIRDKELVQEIEKYQHRNEMNSFIDAVRKLCTDALEIEKIQRRN